MEVYLRISPALTTRCAGELIYFEGINVEMLHRVFRQQFRTDVLRKTSTSIKNNVVHLLLQYKFDKKYDEQRISMLEVSRI